ncbi:hypothetical protein [Ensifer soli]|uniref:hypothetical protein n=1 Tax=Ciceribacter sp. sgz301302 TaxID=3342379 RepID=UPI0035B859BB
MGNVTATVIFCDDVRTEDNGKLLLIGVYSANVEFFVSPAQTHLTTWVRFYGITAGEHTVALSGYYHVGSNKQYLGTSKFSFEVMDGALPLAVATRGMPLFASERGKLVVMAKVDSEEEFEAGYIDVIFHTLSPNQS